MRLTGLAFFVLLAGCGSSDNNDEVSASGVGNSKKISELSTSDLETVCSWANETVADCPDGGLATNDECVKLLDESGCTATVRETEDCIEAMAKQSCEDPMKIEVCDAVTPCFTPKGELPKTTDTP